jgi:hypothetical protein
MVYTFISVVDGSMPVIAKFVLFFPCFFPFFSDFFSVFFKFGFLLKFKTSSRVSKLKPHPEYPNPIDFNQLRRLKLFQPITRSQSINLSKPTKSKRAQHKPNNKQQRKQQTNEYLQQHTTLPSAI